MESVSQHSIPISARPSRTCSQHLHAFFFLVSFISGCFIIHAFQLLFLLPLNILTAENIYDQGIRFTKGAFAHLIIFVNQCFAPTRLSITFEQHGQGKFTQDEINHIVQRDISGNVLALNLPSKAVLIANHQVYSDWWFVWCLTYFMGMHKDVFIVLKNTLKWLPLVGPAMQFYGFIFLARSWASDRLQLSSSLAILARKAQQQNLPFAFILFPEGTLVSEHTRPISMKYAHKLGVPDPLNILLPRSTGLHYCLHSLASHIPSLKLIDITIIYPGIPPKGYGQSFYTLRSIFCDRIPPPVVHMHLRTFDVAKDIPIGLISPATPAVTLNASDHQPLKLNFPDQDQERLAFDQWLRNLWMNKDQFMTEFLQTNRCPHGTCAVEIPLELPSQRKIPHVFTFLAPVAAGLLWSKFVEALP